MNLSYPGNRLDPNSQIHNTLAVKARTNIRSYNKIKSFKETKTFSLKNKIAYIKIVIPTITRSIVIAIYLTHLYLVHIKPISSFVKYLILTNNLSLHQANLLKVNN